MEEGSDKQGDAMSAGDGAKEQVTRRARKVERLRRDQESAGATRSQMEAALERAQRDLRNWSAGAEGERMMAQTLEALGQFGWTALHDVHWPGRPQASIDHVAVGPGGVAVIDTKSWTDEVSLRDGVLWQNGFRRDRELEGAARATAAVTALLVPSYRSAVFGLICLVGQDQDLAPAGSGVRVVGRAQLTSFLSGLPVRLSPSDVADLGRLLTRELTGRSSPVQTTTTHAEGPPAPRRTPGQRMSTTTFPPTPRRPPGQRLSATTFPPRLPAPVRRSPSPTVSPRPPRVARRRRAVVGRVSRIVVAGVLALVLVSNLGQITEAFGSLLASTFSPAASTEEVAPTPSGG